MVLGFYSSAECVPAAVRIEQFKKFVVYGVLLVTFIIILPQGLLGSAQARWAVARRK